MPRHSSHSCAAMLFATLIINPLPRLPFTLRLLLFSLSVSVDCLALCNKCACSEFRLNLLALLSMPLITVFSLTHYNQKLGLNGTALDWF